MTSTINLQDRYYFDLYYLQVEGDSHFTKISRESRQDAVNAYYHYLQRGKNIKWLGKWNGQAFEDTSL